MKTFTIELKFTCCGRDLVTICCDGGYFTIPAEWLSEDGMKLLRSFNGLQGNHDEDIFESVRMAAFAEYARAYRLGEMLDEYTAAFNAGEAYDVEKLRVTADKVSTDSRSYADAVVNTGLYGIGITC